MNIIDSSGWLEYFGGTKHSALFYAAIINAKELLVPTITIYEVFKNIIRDFDQKIAIDFVTQMQQGTVVDLDTEIAMFAAQLSREYSLPMADSIILATARQNNATLWTMDADFKGIPGVKYFAKK